MTTEQSKKYIVPPTQTEIREGDALESLAWAKAKAEINKTPAKEKTKDYVPRDANLIKVAFGDEQLTASIYESALNPASQYGKLLNSMERNFLEQKPIRFGKFSNPEEQLDNSKTELRTKKNIKTEENIIERE